MGNPCHSSSVSPHRCKQRWLPSLVSVRSLHSPYVRAVFLPTGAALLCFSLAVFQNPPYFRDTLTYSIVTLISWGRIFLRCNQCWLVGKDRGVTVQLFRVYGESQHTACARFHSPYPESLFLCWCAGGLTALWCPQGHLPVEKSYHCSPKPSSSGWCQLFSECSGVTAHQFKFMVNHNTQRLPPDFVTVSHHLWYLIISQTSEVCVLLFYQKLVYCNPHHFSL